MRRHVVKINNFTSVGTIAGNGNVLEHRRVPTGLAIRFRPIYSCANPVYSWWRGPESHLKLKATRAEALVRRKTGEESLAEIGRSYNVSGWTISRIKA